MSSRADPLGNFPTHNTAQHRTTPHTTPHNTRVDEGFRWTPTSAPQVQYVSSAAVSWTRSMSRTLFHCSKNWTRANAPRRQSASGAAVIWTGNMCHELNLRMKAKAGRCSRVGAGILRSGLAVQVWLFHNMACGVMVFFPAPPRVPFPPLPSLITPPIPIASPSHVSPREHARTLNARTHRHARAHARTFFRRGPGRTVASTVLGPGPRSILVREAVPVKQHALS